MTDEIRRELMDIPATYQATHLRNTYYSLLTQPLRDELADKLIRFLRPIRLAGQAFSPQEKARLLYEVLSRSLRYDDTKYPAGQGRLRYTYAGGITSGKAVCMGIAELYTLLCTLCGVRCQTIIGYGGDPRHSGGLHAWNLVWLPGPGGTDIPYHADLTWDLEESVSARGFRYYLKGDSFMEANDHTWLKDQYPACPQDASPAAIPPIPPAAVRHLSRQFEQMRCAPAAVQTI